MEIIRLTIFGICRRLGGMETQQAQLHVRAFGSKQYKSHRRVPERVPERVARVYDQQ
jgi:hypothetical protein